MRHKIGFLQKLHADFPVFQTRDLQKLHAPLTNVNSLRAHNLYRLKDFYSQGEPLNKDQILQQIGDTLR